MSKISIKIKSALVDVLIKQNNLFGEKYEEMGPMKFLGEVWLLDKMPSTDERYPTARGDAIQHLVNNDDWSYDYMLKERFSLLNDTDEVFIKFINTIVHPDFKESEDEIIYFVLLINPYLKKVGYTLSIQDRGENGIPIYRVVEWEASSDLPIDIEENKIPFFVTKKPLGENKNEDLHKTPNEFPAFVLEFDKWNDYGIVTNYWLYYYNEDGEKLDVGSVKIMVKIGDDDAINTRDYIPDNFLSLPENFCSLGQSQSFYDNLKEIFTSKKALSILRALRDTALFEDIQEKFEKTRIFITSLIRSSEAERNLREAKYRMYDYDLSNLYSFEYSFMPLYSDRRVDIKFNFDDKLDIPSRIYAIIGKNGVGKTQLLRSLPFNISMVQDNLFTPRTPLFSKVIAVSYSAFDDFKMPLRKGAFNYVYCGLKKEDDTLLTVAEQNERFISSTEKIVNQNRTEQWKDVIGNFLNIELMTKLFGVGEDSTGKTPTEKELMQDVIKAFLTIKKMFSSGQGIMFYIITEIVANIRFDSLLLFDEPETHLHPNAITQLMNTIYELVNQFESYCVLTTHSPLVIREVLSRNVYVMERHEDVPSLRRIGIESFGENLTVLTEEVFGNKDVPKQYKLIIEGLIEKGKTFDEIIEIIQFGNVPVGLNTRIFIKSLIQQRDD